MHAVKEFKQTGKITLEDVLEHPALFDKDTLLKVLRDRYKYAEWMKGGKRPRHAFIMLHEIDYIKESLQIENYVFEKNSGRLHLGTNHGMLIFNK